MITPIVVAPVVPIMQYSGDCLQLGELIIYGIAILIVGIVLIDGFFFKSRLCIALFDKGDEIGDTLISVFKRKFANNKPIKSSNEPSRVLDILSKCYKPTENPNEQEKQ